MSAIDAKVTQVGNGWGNDQRIWLKTDGFVDNFIIDSTNPMQKQMLAILLSAMANGTKVQIHVVSGSSPNYFIDACTVFNQ